MLTDLLLKEIEENFDTTRIDFEIHFDDADTHYGTRGVYGIENIVKKAQENAKDSLHAILYIRDSDQSYIYDYDVKNDILSRRDEDTGEFHQPLLKEDQWLKEKEKEIKEELKKLNKQLLRQFLFGSIPFVISVILFLTIGEDQADKAMLALQLSSLWEIFLVLSIVLRKFLYDKNGF